jgi:hypothetical protein
MCDTSEEEDTCVEEKELLSSVIFVEGEKSI